MDLGARACSSRSVAHGSSSRGTASSKVRRRVTYDERRGASGSAKTQLGSDPVDVHREGIGSLPVLPLEVVQQCDQLLPCRGVGGRLTWCEATEGRDALAEPAVLVLPDKSGDVFGRKFGSRVLRRHVRTGLGERVRRGTRRLVDESGIRDDLEHERLQLA